MSYDPAIGTWTEADPKQYIDGPDRYQFVLSNPLRFCDPLGEAAGDGTPTTRPSPPPSHGNGWVIGGSFDLVLISAPDVNGLDNRGFWNTYAGQNPNSDVVAVATAREIADAILVRQGQIAESTGDDSAQISVLLLAHGSPEGADAHSASGEQLFPDASGLSPLTRPTTQELTNEIGQLPIGDAAGRISQLTVAACNLALGADGQRLLQAIANALGATVTASDRAGRVYPHGNSIEVDLIAQIGEAEINKQTVPDHVITKKCQKAQQ